MSKECPCECEIAGIGFFPICKEFEGDKNESCLNCGHDLICHDDKLAIKNSPDIVVENNAT